MLSSTVRQRIRELRITAGLTPEEAAQKAGVSWGYWRQLERGRDVNPSVAVLDRMAQALGYINHGIFYASPLDSEDRAS